MIAAAAEPGVGQAHVNALERAYFPWIGALHSMLDQLIDIEEDALAAQCNLVELYGSTAEAAERMALLAGRALACARALEPAHRHELIVAAMASFYLSAPEARVGEAAVVSRAVLDVFGELARPGLAIFKGRRALGSGHAALSRSHQKLCRRAPGSLAVARPHVLVAVAGTGLHRQERPQRVA